MPKLVVRCVFCPMKVPRYQIKTIVFATTAIAAFLAITIWYFDVPHAPVERVEALHGQTDVSIITQLGNPSYEYVFTMADPLSEFQIELYNIYPPDSPGNAQIEIRECTWRYSRYRLTVWFHKPNGEWIALDTCRYRNGILF